MLLTTLKNQVARIERHIVGFLNTFTDLLLSDDSGRNPPVDQIVISASVPNGSAMTCESKSTPTPPTLASPVAAKISKTENQNGNGVNEPERIFRSNLKKKPTATMGPSARDQNYNNALLL